MLARRCARTDTNYQPSNQAIKQPASQPIDDSNVELFLLPKTLQIAAEVETRQNVTLNGVSLVSFDYGWRDISSQEKIKTETKHETSASDSLQRFSIA